MFHQNRPTNVNGIDYKAGNSVAADVSLFYTNKNENGKGWAAGFGLSNLGSKISYTNADDQADFIPASLSTSAAYTEVWDEQNRITFAADINKLLVPAVPANADDIVCYQINLDLRPRINTGGGAVW